MKTETFTSAMTMMVTIITTFFDRVSAAPVSSAAPAPIIENLPPIADIEIEARDASANALAEAAPIQGDVGDWIIRARHAEFEELERREKTGTTSTVCTVM